MTDSLPELTAEERAVYEWQMWVPGVGEEGQRKLKAATVFISRVGGLGSVVALELAAAGVGGLILAQADIVVDAAPMFEERLAMNRAAFAQRKPMVECAMHELTAHVTTFIPG